ncbi:MAG: hypothetical protein ACJ74O_06105 [Frankiaceae bacterium]
MSELQLYQPSTLPLLRDERRTGRAISRVRSGGAVRLARVDTEVDIAVGKMDGLTLATGQGLGAVGRVAQAEQQLVQLAPLASGRLAYLADRHMLAVGDVLDDLRRDLRRC